ncbi:hypothetical protein HJG60_010377 [Phyllostomus discolor]|uniref:Uncharacterized protein n=1 Tax=Phyllostomus discolor TaxID=89673 RepID=A0A834EKC4_9CHIR|nr:hypothetical protein HJG60_010377 [Phyllostomus discolor]
MHAAQPLHLAVCLHPGVVLSSPCVRLSCRARECRVYYLGGKSGQAQGGMAQGPCFFSCPVCPPGASETIDGKTSGLSSWIHFTCLFTYLGFHGGWCLGWFTLSGGSRCVATDTASFSCATPVPSLCVLGPCMFFLCIDKGCFLDA